MPRVSPLGAVLVTPEGPLTRAGLRGVALRRPAAAAAGCLDHEHVARRHLDAGDVVERVDAAVGALDAVDSRLAGAAAGGAERAGMASVREDRRGHRLEEA